MAQAGGSGPALRCAQRMAPGNTDLAQTTHLRHYSQPAAHRVQEYVNAFVERATKPTTQPFLAAASARRDHAYRVVTLETS